MTFIARRQVVASIGALLSAPLVFAAQTPGKPIRIGWIGVNTLDNPETRSGWDAFRSELQRRGWEEARNVRFEQRFTKGDETLARQYVRELVESKVDLVVTLLSVAARALKDATTSIPVVFVTIPDPVKSGLVASLARPGGNITGFSTSGTELIGKRLELLKEAFPHIASVAYFPSPLEATNELTASAANKLGLKLLITDSPKDGNFARAIAALRHADAWYIGEYMQNYANARTIIDAISKQGKPAMYPSSFFTALGGLMSYAVDQRDQYRRTAALVDRILRGAKPADLPVEQPNVFEFVVNMKTAKALGFKIPQSMLFRIDRVIE